MKTHGLLRYVARPAQVFMVTLLLLLAVVFVQVAVVEMTPMVWRRRPAAPAQTSRSEMSAEQKKMARIRHARKEFLPDGTLHLITENGRLTLMTETGAFRRGAHPDSTHVQIHDTNDTLLWEGSIQEQPYHYLPWTQNIRSESLTPRDMRFVQRLVDPMTLEVPVATENTLMEKWRYRPWTDTFVGYDLEGNTLGHLGETGGVESKSDSRPFGPFRNAVAWWPLDAYGPTALWQTAQRLYQIHFAKRQTEVIFESLATDIVNVGVLRWGAYIPERSAATAETPQLLSCQTRNGSYFVIARDPNRTIAVQTPDAWKARYTAYCQFTRADQTLFMRRNWIDYPAAPKYYDSDWRAQFNRTDKTQWTELYRISDTGELSLVNRFGWVLPGQDQNGSFDRYRDVRATMESAVTTVSPLFHDFLWTGYLERRAMLYADIDWMRDFLEFVNGVRPRYSPWSWLCTAVMVVLTFLHSRTRQTSKGALAFWLVFVGLLNVAGFLAYWALNHTPVIKCPTCGKHRGLSQSACVRCGAVLPTPEHGKLDLIFGL